MNHREAVDIFLKERVIDIHIIDEYTTDGVTYIVFDTESGIEFIHLCLHDIIMISNKDPLYLYKMREKNINLLLKDE